MNSTSAKSEDSRKQTVILCQATVSSAGRLPPACRVVINRVRRSKVSLHQTLCSYQDAASWPRKANKEQPRSRDGGAVRRALRRKYMRRRETKSDGRIAIRGGKTPIGSAFSLETDCVAAKRLKPYDDSSLAPSTPRSCSFPSSPSSAPSPVGDSRFPDSIVVSQAVERPSQSSCARRFSALHTDCLAYFPLDGRFKLDRGRGRVA